jgi:uncharacterized protein (DUF1800 family)
MFALSPARSPRIQRAFAHARSLALIATAAAALTACGGGGGGGGDKVNTGSDTAPVATQAQAAPRSDDEAHRFLVQATFGPRAEDIARVRDIGYERWIDEQFASPVMGSHLAMVDASAAFKARVATNGDMIYSWWTHAVEDNAAQLRHKTAFALSQIFVVSTLPFDESRTVASYLDMLTAKADGSYRDLLEGVALHPAMGQYLSHLANRKEDGHGRVPDENFAREVMQLFSIGLYELDDAGKPKVSNGQQVETYNANDIKGLARVFTGFSWQWPNAKSGLDWWKCFWRWVECRDPSQRVTAMSAYPAEHSQAEKNFLGVTVPAQASADPRASLKAALDRLASHPNTAPFISRQLIQRLVTSNPSDQYVTDITQVFRRTGGNLKSVVKEILMHPEARHPATALGTTANFGKVREPILRLAHLLRALPHSSAQYASSGGNRFYLATDTSDPGTQLGQTPMRAPSVFNYYRPGYRPPQTLIADRGMVAPEMQITTEASVLGYANFVAQILDSGWGEWNASLSRSDVLFDFSAWTGQAANPAALIDALAIRLIGRPLADAARAPAIVALNAMPSASSYQKRQRIQAAALMVAVSPDFSVQQ